MEYRLTIAVWFSIFLLNEVVVSELANVHISLPHAKVVVGILQQQIQNDERASVSFRCLWTPLSGTASKTSPRL